MKFVDTKTGVILDPNSSFVEEMYQDDDRYKAVTGSAKAKISAPAEKKLSAMTLAELAAAGAEVGLAFTVDGSDRVKKADRVKAIKEARERAENEADETITGME